MTHDGMDDKDFDRVLAEMRRIYNAPPQPPLDAMWERIEGEHFGARGRRPVRGSRARATWWLAIAAALVAGVGIGRLTSHAAQTVATADSPRATPPGGGPRAPRLADSTSYDGATTSYFGQTAALLIALPTEARAGRAEPRFVARAAELLTTTRLLLDSPAAADPKVRALLEDVELVLAQVARLEPNRGRVELELIAQALEQRDLLPRLTSAVARSTEADN
jgi:hypothetical protein